MYVSGKKINYFESTQQSRSNLMFRLYYLIDLGFKSPTNMLS